MSHYGDINELAPVILFAYNRPRETLKTLEALKRNYLANETSLIIFADGPKGERDLKEVQETRTILKSVSGFRDVKLHEAPSNKGLANSIIDGVTKVLQLHDKVIVLEDDLITSPNFLDFMNQSLCFYERYEKILSVTGFSLPLKGLPQDKDFYTGYRASSWAWGTWRRAWSNIDWEMTGVNSFFGDREAIRRFNRGGSDMTKMLEDQVCGRIDSWAIRFCYHQSVNDLVTVFPVTSKAINIGFGDSATHTFSASRFATTLDAVHKRDFSFSNQIDVDSDLAKSFRTFYSFRVRLVGKLSKYLKKLSSSLK